LRILGIVFNTHDSGVALVNDGRPIIIVEEERLNRIKHTHEFPRQSLSYLLQEGWLSFSDLDGIAIPWNLKRFRRTFAASILKSFPAGLNLINQRSHPQQLNKIVFLNHRLRLEVYRCFGQVKLPPIATIGHHDAHAAAFFVSPFDEAVILVMDGYGDDAATSVYTGRGNQVTRLWHTDIFNSIGIVYTLVTLYLGLGGFSNEGKTMALSAYGRSTFVEQFRDVLKVTADGRYLVNMDYFDFDAYGLLKPFKPKFFDTFGPARREGEPLEQRHRDVARALQTVVEETILHMVDTLARQHNIRNLIISGGVALNCVANSRVMAAERFSNVWVPPIASDSGAPFGAALWCSHQVRQQPRTFVLETAFFGIEYSPSEIVKAFQAAGVPYALLDEKELLSRVAGDLASGKIVCWFQGRFEIGPRALGNRSILADPRREGMKSLLNSRIKHRESFRPFAPAVQAEHVDRFFEFIGTDPFMTMAPKVKADAANLIPAVIHVDGTARIQTVERRANARFYDLINTFGGMTGVPVLLNTSFNENEPIVARPGEALDCFLRTDLDAVAIGDYYCSKAMLHDAARSPQREMASPNAAH
jgi:carbamoyltransferase